VAFVLKNAPLMQSHGNINKNILMTRRSIIKTMLALGAGLLVPVFGKSKYIVNVLQYRCVGCKDCYRVCPVDAIKFIRGKAVVDNDSCNGCLLCPAACSYGAIETCEKEI
jgi:NAD-dependent dihydropyrimidine dehydrogenase PreA subunit